MKKVIFILLLLSTFNVSAQNYDLIVTTKGDSIACFIDSVSNTQIYFEMQLKDSWIHTMINKNKITEYKYNAIDRKLAVFKPGSSYIDKIEKPIDFFDRKLYVNRYLFAPSAFGMKSGVLSYTNYNIGLHDFQYGFSDKFSFGFGTSMFFLPIYFMPTYTMSINDKSAFAIGDLLMISPYSDLSFFGNLFYGMYTRGNLDNNFSVGVGLWTTPESDMAAKTISPAINLSAMIKTGKNSYFITENYVFQYNINAPVVDSFDPDSRPDECFFQEKIVFGGLSGFRIISKRNPKNSWQYSVAYIIVSSGDAPDEYKQPIWDIRTGVNSVSFFPFPILSYSRKF